MKNAIKNKNYFAKKMVKLRTNFRALLTEVRSQKEYKGPRFFPWEVVISVEKRGKTKL